MSTKEPSTVNLSLEEFSKHGGLTGAHKDGWGVAWYDDGDVHLRKEPFAAAYSDGMQRVISNAFQCTVALSHIRKATQGEVVTRNCQPFIRELGGKWHTFIHNGDLGGIRHHIGFALTSFQPVGETDSEYAFCALLSRLRVLWGMGVVPAVDDRRAVIGQFASELRALGPANFLYFDGDTLFAHGHKRHQVDGSIRAPGLWMLKRHCTQGGRYSGQGLTIDAKDVDQEVVLFASVPLTHEAWEPLSEGAVLAARQGQEIVGNQ